MAVIFSPMNTFIVSDLHIGSKYFKHAHFVSFLEALPGGGILVLNGDTIDNPSQPLAGVGLEVVLRLVELSKYATVIWVEGNHDQEFRPPVRGEIIFKLSHTIGDQQVFITHGAYFDNVMPYHRWFIRLFQFLHNLRLRLGAPPVHVAEYAKKWEFFYRYLHKTVMMNAVEYAREKGYRAVVCGHVHHIEHRIVDGIEYVNTGAWTEYPTCYASVVDGTLSLLEWRGAEEPPRPLSRHDA